MLFHFISQIRSRVPFSLCNVRTNDGLGRRQRPALLAAVLRTHHRASARAHVRLMPSISPRPAPPADYVFAGLRKLWCLRKRTSDQVNDQASD